MQSSKGKVLNYGKSAAFQRLLTTTVPTGLLGRGSNKVGRILHHHLSISISAPMAYEGGGFFNSFFGKNVELQHAPHKQVGVEMNKGDGMNEFNKVIMGY